MQSQLVVHRLPECRIQFYLVVLQGLAELRRHLKLVCRFSRESSLVNIFYSAFHSLSNVADIIEQSDLVEELLLVIERMSQIWSNLVSMDISFIEHAQSVEDSQELQLVLWSVFILRKDELIDLGRQVDETHSQRISGDLAELVLRLESVQTVEVESDQTESFFHFVFW